MIATLTIVATVTKSTARRALGLPRSRTGQTASPETAARRRSRARPMGMRSRPTTNSAGTNMKTTMPAYGFCSASDNSSATRTKKSSALAVVSATPIAATRLCRTRAKNGRIVGARLLLQAEHVRDERVLVGLRQARVGFHRWLAGGVRLLHHLGRIDQPLVNIVSAHRFPDRVERPLRVAFPRDRVAQSAFLRGE